MNGEATRQQNVVAALTYLLGLITALIFMNLEPYSKDDFVRYHARQSIVFSVAWFALNVIVGVFVAVLPHGLGILFALLLELANIALAIFWVFLMYKAYIGERYQIPTLSEWAEDLGF